MGFSTIDGGLRVLVSWSSVQVREYPDFATPGREFLTYQNDLRPTWLLQKAVEDGATLEALKYQPGRGLIRAHLKP